MTLMDAGTFDFLKEINIPMEISRKRYWGKTSCDMMPQVNLERQSMGEILGHDLRILSPPHGTPINRDVDMPDDTFWQTLRRTVLPLRSSQYDMTSRCNLTCEGCLFFSGTDYLGHSDEEDAATIDAFFRSEAERGINYGYFGGAEPSLVEGKLLAAARHIPHGVVFTNGTRRLSSEIPYRIHVSVWGRPERSREVRGAEMLAKQVRNYRGDKRAVFVFTVTAQNIDDLPWIADYCRDEELPLTFNHYSPTSRYTAFVGGEVAADRYHARDTTNSLILGADDLVRSRTTIDQLMQQPGSTILYSETFNRLIHDPVGLYPERDTLTGNAVNCANLLGGPLRHHNTDLSYSAERCCTPNISCETCRLYVQSFATVLARARGDLRAPGGRSNLIGLWKLWSALFLDMDMDRVGQVSA